MTNKTNEIIKHLQEKGNITSMEAIKLYGATRLSGIIFNLRKRGYLITNKKETDIDRYGNECRYVRYVYIGYDNPTRAWKNCLRRFFGK